MAILVVAVSHEVGELLISQSPELPEPWDPELWGQGPRVFTLTNSHGYSFHTGV